MASRRKKVRGKPMKRRLSAGRGLGKGKDYKPWFYLPSKDTNSIVTGREYGGKYHLLSALERNHFRCLWSDNTLEIFEQSALLPRIEVMHFMQAWLRQHHESQPKSDQD